MIDIIGTGFGRTGTISAYLALRMLKLGPVFHNCEFTENPGLARRIHDVALGGRETWPELLNDYRACLDFPCCMFWKDLREAFPDAKVLHTTRDPDEWYDSIHATIFAILKQPFPDDPEIRELSEMTTEVVLRRGFDMELDDRAHCTEVFRRHEAEILASVPKDKLLVFDVRQGWAPLCEFLEVPVPDEKFPRTNDRAEFREQLGLA